MSTNSADIAASRLLTALRRISEGLERQRSRIIDRSNSAPRLLEGTSVEVINLSGDPGNDLDYYVYELARLQDLARTTIKTFAEFQPVVDALAVFDAAVPNLRRIRNPLTHPSDDERLDRTAWLGSIVNLEPDGSVESLVDPRYQHHDAALALIQALGRYLRGHLQLSIQADPPKPLDQTNTAP